jgi:hypothetical protein
MEDKSQEEVLPGSLKKLNSGRKRRIIWITGKVSRKRL